MSGSSLELDSIEVPPKDNRAIFARPPGDGTLTGIVLEPGFSLIRLMVGPQVLEALAPEEMDKVSIPVKAGQNIILVVRNDGEEPKTARGSVFIEGLTAPAKAASAPTATTPGVMTWPNAAPPSAAADPRAVVAGPNEVIVVLSWGDAERLFRSVKGETLSDREKPSIERALGRALGVLPP